MSLRRLDTIVLAVASVIVVVVAVIFFSFDVNRFRPRIEEQISRTFGRTVTMGKLGLRAFPLSIRIEDLTIAESKDFPRDKPFATAKAVFAKASLLSLLRGKPELQSLELLQPRVQLIRAASGKWNFARMGTADPTGDAIPISLGEISLADGFVSIVDLRPGANVSQYDHIDLKVNQFSFDRPFSATLSAHLSGEGKQLVQLAATVGPIDSKVPVNTPFSGELILDEAGLGQLSTITVSDTKDNTLGGSVSGHATVKIVRGELTADGHLDLKRLRTRGIDLGFPIAVDFGIGANLNEEFILLRKVAVQLDRTTFQISGTVNAKPTPNVLDIDFKVPETSMGELARFAGAFGFATGVNASGRIMVDVKVSGPSDEPAYHGKALLANAKIQLDGLTKPLEIRSADIAFDRDEATVENLFLSIGPTEFAGRFGIKNFKDPRATFTISTNKLDVTELESLAQTTVKSPAKSTTQSKRTAASTLDKMTAHGTLDAESIAANGLVLSKVHAGVAFERGALRLSPVTAQFFGGTEAGTIAVDLRPAHPGVTVQALMNGVDTNQLLSAVGGGKGTLYGKLAAKTNIQLIAQPDGGLIKSLNGTIGFNVTNGELRNVDLLKELGRIAKFTGAPPPTKGATTLNRLSGDLVFANGIANTRNLVAELPQGTVTATGSVNLVNQALDMRAVAILLSGPSKNFGGQLVGGYMSTVLANRKGELVIPAIVKGTTAAPKFEPDLVAMAKLKATNLLPSVGSLLTVPGSAGAKLSGILGALGGAPPAGTEPTPQQTAGGILGGFFKSLTTKKTDQKQ